MSFIPLYDASKNTLAEGYWFLFREGRLVVREGEEISVPRKEAGQKSAALEDAASRVQKVIYAGSMDGTSCYAADTAPDRDLPAGLAAMPLRSLYGKIPQASLQAARFIAHLLHWDRQTGFCGVCGGPLRNKEDERAKTCARCGALFYPRISPAIIVAILDKEKILLAHNKRFASPVYSLIAGFIEMGETAEECIAREAEEEVGVQVKNIRYFGSQPWPFPDSLMLGFTAEYAGGEIRVDHSELVDAKWFSPPRLPPLPAGDSIARKIITWYEKEYLPSCAK